MISIKDKEQMAAMREAGRIAANVLKETSEWVKAGVSTREIDEFAASRIRHYGCRSAFLGYEVQGRKYPCHICISMNEEVVHGLASKKRLVAEGDIVSLDVGVEVGGYIGDNARTVIVGQCPEETEKLVEVTKEALYDGISRALPGNRVVDISSAVQNRVEANGFSVVREFVGHGVGQTVHEEPQIPNFVSGGNSPELRPGMTLAIEPMVNAGGVKVKCLSDGWTVVTRDGRPSAHWEHTIAVTEGEPEILTCPDPNPSEPKAE